MKGKFQNASEVNPLMVRILSNAGGTARFREATKLPDAIINAYLTGKIELREEAYFGWANRLKMDVADLLA